MRTHWVIGVLLALTPAFLPAGDFEFVVIGDTRPRFESESFRPFENLISRINTLEPDLVINLGDLIYGYGPRSKEKQWDRYQAVAATIRVPYYQVPGNHDTHSRSARRIYGERFGKFYQSFDHGPCHFVLLDNTEEQRWGYLGPGQLAWLKADLQQTRARAVFVFMHFPVWEPERVTPQYYAFWERTLHPLFRANRVRAVFAGHYHAYGPTRQFDGIRYFITGGGGAELRPEYRQSGGEHHFMRVQVSDAAFDVRVVTERGEMTDPEADVMGGLLFAARNVSRIGIRPDTQDLRTGVPFTVSVDNPYPQVLSGQAAWVMDASAFSVDPKGVSIRIPPGQSRTFAFTLKALLDHPPLASLPRLEFRVAAGSTQHRFHREVRLLQTMTAPLRAAAPALDGQLTDWTGLPSLVLGDGSAPAEFRSAHDGKTLYLALTVPALDAAEARESGFGDEVQIGLARHRSGTDFGGDFLRLGLNRDLPRVQDRTPGHKHPFALPGVQSVARTHGQRTTYEIAIPLRLLGASLTGKGAGLVLDLSFPAAEEQPSGAERPEPGLNSFAYRVRYGSDSLVPVYFVELRLEPGHRP
ncbi:MAG: metallophosphoesterase [Verrucomicrobia bacterium]|nr:metallophosphoesterase [Verrucomicrobiota bacterium]